MAPFASVKHLKITQGRKLCPSRILKRKTPFTDGKISLYERGIIMLYNPQTAAKCKKTLVEINWAIT